LSGLGDESEVEQKLFYGFHDESSKLEGKLSYSAILATLFVQLMLHLAPFCLCFIFLEDRLYVFSSIMKGEREAERDANLTISSPCGYFSCMTNDIFLLIVSIMMPILILCLEYAISVSL
jgi:hypothetical protein